MGARGLAVCLITALPVKSEVNDKDDYSMRRKSTMNILIAVASRHGSTRRIAEVIGQELSNCGHSVQVRSAAEADSAEPYDAAIVGSAIYMGNWLAEARRFVEKYRATLSVVPVWLFSSGPLGRDDPKPPGDVAHLPELMQATQARGHRTFVGKLDKGDLGLGERLAVKLVKAPDGDFRDWEAIRGWAREIASALPEPVPSGT
jgi:menaquinone-dependent protoporphyrinogen oxidase